MPGLFKGQDIDDIQQTRQAKPGEQNRDRKGEIGPDIFPAGQIRSVDPLVYGIGPEPDYNQVQAEKA